MWRTATAAILALAAGAAAAVCVSERWRHAVDSAVPEWTRLPNGLQFRAQRIKGAKDVAVVTVFGIGSDGDPLGQIGLAHLAEHLYVTSAAGAAPARTVDEWSEHYDKQCAAETHDTFTCMAGVVGPQRLERELADVAARISELRIESTDLDRERPRVLEQIEDSNEPAASLMAAKRLARGRILDLPNAGQAGGIPADVDRLTLDDVRKFARRFYRPANARIAVAGDVDPGDVAALVTKLFAKLPAGEPAPAPPEIEPRSEILRIEPGATPGPEYEPCQWVWIAYPCHPDGSGSNAVVEALGIWGTPPKSASERRSEGFFLVFADNRSVLAGWTGDERPVEEVTRRFDAHVEHFVQHATGDQCAERIRDAMRSYDEAVKEMRKHGFEMPEREPTSSWAVAFGLAIGNSPEMTSAAIERLTTDDIRRSVAKWHVAERRVVVDFRGWRRSRDPDADTKTEKPTPARVPSLPLVPDVRITLTWDETTQTMHRTLGDREYAKDDDLQKAVAEAHDAWVKKGKSDTPVTIDADHRIPWSEVITVVNIIKRCGIEKIEFAMGAPPKAKPPK